MEPNFNYEELQCQLNLSSQRQQYGLGGVQQGYWDEGSYGGYQEPPQWYNSYPTPCYSKWNQESRWSYSASYGGHYQVQPLPPSPYYEEQPPYEGWPFQQTSVQQERSTKTIRELFI